MAKTRRNRSKKYSRKRRYSKRVKRSSKKTRKRTRKSHKRRGLFGGGKKPEEIAREAREKLAAAKPDLDQVACDNDDDTYWSKGKCHNQGSGEVCVMQKTQKECEGDDAVPVPNCYWRDSLGLYSRCKKIMVTEDGKVVEHPPSWRY